MSNMARFKVEDKRNKSTKTERNIDPSQMYQAGPKVLDLLVRGRTQCHLTPKPEGDTKGTAPLPATLKEFQNLEEMLANASSGRVPVVNNK